MQTFLPYPDFAASAATLDRQRLGKQRVEVLQLLTALANPTQKGWQSHPCTRMWRRHERHLIAYGVAICDEWISRGYKDTCREKILDFRGEIFPLYTAKPPWLGDPALHASHRAALLYKDPEFYSKFGWQEDPATPDPKTGSLPYVWPA